MVYSRSLRCLRLILPAEEKRPNVLFVLWWRGRLADFEAPEPEPSRPGFQPLGISDHGQGGAPVRLPMQLSFVRNPVLTNSSVPKLSKFH